MRSISLSLSLISLSLSLSLISPSLLLPPPSLFLPSSSPPPLSLSLCSFSSLPPSLHPSQKKSCHTLKKNVVQFHFVLNTYYSDFQNFSRMAVPTHQCHTSIIIIVYLAAMYVRSNPYNTDIHTKITVKHTAYTCI